MCTPRLLTLVALLIGALTCPASSAGEGSPEFLLCTGEGGAASAALQSSSRERASMPAETDCETAMPETLGRALLVDVREPSFFRRFGVAGATNVPLRSVSHATWPVSQAIVLAGDGKNDADLLAACQHLRRTTQRSDISVVRDGLRTLADHRPTYGTAADWRSLAFLTAREFVALQRSPLVRTLTVGDDDDVQGTVSVARTGVFERHMPTKRRLRRLLNADSKAQWVVVSSEPDATELGRRLADIATDSRVLFYTAGRSGLASLHALEASVAASKSWTPPSACSLL